MVTGKRTTPLRSIRKYCLWCVMENRAEVASCVYTSCALYPYRLGRSPRTKTLSAIKSIKLKCLDCSTTTHEAKGCLNIDCPLYPFRQGRNPNRTGIGGSKARGHALVEWRKQRVREALIEDKKDPFSGGSDVQ